jgi:hypothetical protein
MHVRQAKAATDKATVAKQFANLFGRCVSRNIEVLWLATEQHVPYGTAHEMCLVSGLVQAIKHLDGILRDVGARDIVF